MATSEKDSLARMLRETITAEPGKCITLHRRVANRILATLEGMPDQPSLAALRDALTVRCCHTTGTHDPKHFEQQRYVCSDQKGRAFDQARTLLGMGEATPESALPTPGCYWCERAAGKKE